MCFQQENAHKEVKKMQFSNITVCLDMFGCPNRCKHCWVGHAPNARLTAADLQFVAESFRPFAEELTVYDWYREPDYSDDYRELWALCNRLSGRVRDHFELVSVWRLVRDREYVKWLSSIGLRAAQLTIFGGPEKTDYYTGRQNAYNEILQAVEILLAHQIAPRIQMFLNQDNTGELPFVQQLLQDLQLEERCASFGGTFSFFLHQGSCDGENEKLYGIRVTPDDLAKIPPPLAAYTLRHFGKNSLEEVFGQTEQALCRELAADRSTKNLVSCAPVFHVDSRFNVYPNLDSPEPIWRVGNLKTDGAQAVLQNYAENKSPAQHVRQTVPLGEIVRAVGDPSGRRLFTKNDYIEYILNKYSRKFL